MVGSASRSESDDAQSSCAELTEAADLDPDDIYHILQTSRRREVLRYLRTETGPVRLRELAEQIAAWEHETSIENLHSDQRQRVYISLYQSHLPKLDNRGIISYDKDRGTIESTPAAAQFDPYLTGLENDEASDPWPTRYAGAVIGNGLFLMAVTGGMLSVSGLGAAAVVVLSFGLVTAAHAYSVQNPFW